MNKKINDAFNDQINEEMFSFYLYLSMSAYFEDQNMPGMAHWMRIQADEEYQHVMRFYNFINDRDGRVLLQEIKAPQTEWKSYLDAFEAAYKHEQFISSKIAGLVDLAIAENDHPVNSFLQWFVNEQVEEEATSKSIVDQLKMTGDYPASLIMIDRELGARPPATPLAQQGK